MKNLFRTSLILAALIIFLIINDSVYSQSSISSINSGTKAVLKKELLKESKISTELNVNKENWMSKKSYLDMNSSSLSLKELFILNETVIDQENEIEGWMVIDSFWSIKENIFKEEYPEEISECQEWMYDEYFWQIKDNNECCPLEAWMTDKNFWVLVH